MTHLAIQDQRLGDRIFRRQFANLTGDHFRFGEAFLLHQLVEFVDFRGDGVVDLELMQSSLFDFLEHALIAFVQFDVAFVLFDVRVEPVDATIDKREELFLRGRIQLGLIDAIAEGVHALRARLSDRSWSFFRQLSLRRRFRDTAFDRPAAVAN